MPCPRPAAPPRAPSPLAAVPAWHRRSLTALLSYQRAEPVDGVDQELSDHRLVGRVHVAEGLLPPRPDQRYRFLDLLPPGVGKVQPHDPAVGGLPATLDVTVADQGVHDRGHRAGRPQAPGRDLTRLEPVPGG